MGNIYDTSVKGSEKHKNNLINVYSNGDEYIGDLKQDIREGNGVYVYSNGDRYEGQWHENQKHGKGCFYYKNGEFYIGEWKLNKKHGNGMYFYRTFDRYDGQWIDNLKCGKGILYFANGSYFQGTFKESKKHGLGYLHLKDGSIYEEMWDEGVLSQKRLIKKPDEEEDEDKTASKTEKLPKKKDKKLNNSKHKPGVSKHKGGEGILGKLITNKQGQLPNLELAWLSKIDFINSLNKSLLKKNIDEWESIDIHNWLIQINLEKYYLNFQKNHITGKNLFDLTEGDLLEEIKITDANDRKALSKEIKFLRKFFPENSAKNAYMRKKLVQFFEKNRDRFLMSQEESFNIKDLNQNLMLKKSKSVKLKKGNHQDENKLNHSDEEGALDKLAAQPENPKAEKSDSAQKLNDISAKNHRNLQKPNTHIIHSKFGDTVDIEDLNIDKEKDEIKESSSDSAESSSSSEEEKKSPKSPPQSEIQVVQKDEKEDLAEKARELVRNVKEKIGSKCFIDINEIKIYEKIGEGGYGEVYQGVWLGQDVAIKVYGKKSRKEKKFGEDFLKELEVIGKIRHPNVVLFMGVSIYESKGMLITEYVEGGSLFDHLHKQATKFTDEEKLDICYQIALGMSYLHSSKILHCDLKSSNILLDKNYTVKLCDFGLSKILKKLDNKKNAKRIGTPHWMAPEIMKEEIYDEYSDVYSYGMILWEMIANKVPYFGLSIHQIVGSVGYGEYQVKIPDKGHPIIIDVMRRCLNKDRMKRPNFKEITMLLKDEKKQKSNMILKELEIFFSQNDRTLYS